MLKERDFPLDFLLQEDEDAELPMEDSDDVESSKEEDEEDMDDDWVKEG